MSLAQHFPLLAAQHASQVQPQQPPQPPQPQLTPHPLMQLPPNPAAISPGQPLLPSLLVVVHKCRKGGDQVISRLKSDSSHQSLGDIVRILACATLECLRGDTLPPAVHSSKCVMQKRCKT